MQCNVIVSLFAVGAVNEQFKPIAAAMRRNFESLYVHDSNTFRKSMRSRLVKQQGKIFEKCIAEFEQESKK